MFKGPTGRIAGQTGQPQHRRTNGNAQGNRHAFISGRRRKGLLGAGRAAYASGPQFAALKSMTVSSLENLPAVRGLPASQQPVDMVPLIDELAALKTQVAELRDELRTARLRAA